MEYNNAQNYVVLCLLISWMKQLKTHATCMPPDIHDIKAKRRVYQKPPKLLN